MKPKWIPALGVAALAAATVVGAELARSGGAAPTEDLRRIPAQELPYPMSVPVAPFEVTWAQGVLEAANMYFPAELQVLEVIHSEPTKRQAVDLAARIGEQLPGEALGNWPEQPLVEGYCSCGWQDFHMDILADGNLRLVWADRDLPAEYFTDPNANPAPRTTVDAAVAVADRFVKESGLLPEGARMVEVIPKTAISRYDQAAGGDDKTAISCTVTYRRFWDGIPEGAVGVHVTGKGEIFSFGRNMPNVRSLGRYPILSPDEAREMIGSPASRVITSNAPAYTPVSGVIEKVEMEYYDGATAWRYDTIQPIYIFTGTGWDREGRPQTFKALVPAIRPEYLQPVDLPVPGGAGGSAKIKGD